MPSKAVEIDNAWFNTTRGRRYKDMKIAVAKARFSGYTARGYILKVLGPEGVPEMARMVRRLLGRDHSKKLPKKEAVDEAVTILESLDAEIRECLVLLGQLQVATGIDSHGPEKKPQ